MRKTFAAFVAVAAIAGSLAATRASAQRGVAPGVTARGRYWPAPYGAGPGPYNEFGSFEWVTQLSGTAMAGGSAECESAAEPRLRRD
jgi:hypothetical protein